MSKTTITWSAGVILIAGLVLTLMISPLLAQALTFSIPDTSAAANTLLRVPVRTTNVTGLGILSLAITLSFDPTVLDALGANSLGTISQSWGNPLTTDVPDTLKLVLTGLKPLEGEGILTYLFFDVMGSKGDTTTIKFEAVSINEGGIVAATVAGKFTTLEGEPAPDIRLAMPDTSSAVGSIVNLPILVSDLTGFNIDSLSLTFTFSKYVVRALDIVKTGTLTESWTDSIEVLLPGKVSIFLTGTPALKDSGTLCRLQFLVKGRPGMSTPIHFQSLQFYNDTLKIGTQDGKITVSGGITSDVTVSIPDISADSSNIVDIPAFISDVTGREVRAVSIYLKFDSKILSYQNYKLTNTLLEGWQNLVNVAPDTVKFGAFSASSLVGQGIMIEFQFKVIGRPGMQSALTFVQMTLNEGSPSVIAYDGLFTVNYVIPVELASFHATVVEGNVLLTWNTASESNNYGFEVERAIYPDHWSKIGFAPGHGSTTISHQYSFLDNMVEAGTYYYRLKQIDFDGMVEYSQVVSATIGLPHSFTLSQNYPNPFNPITVITFELPIKTTIKLTLYDILGQEVKVITSGEYPAGHHEVSLNARELGSGLYFYQLQAGRFAEIRKLLILK